MSGKFTALGDVRNACPNVTFLFDRPQHQQHGNNPGSRVDQRIRIEFAFGRAAQLQFLTTLTSS